ncbi:hypothetical protein BGX38DRAFT_1172189 [Terfezia claveryi]|nr:hypothetical protein BGX38DRAFT_1172189 [Terfezia claveryi]
MMLLLKSCIIGPRAFVGHRLLASALIPAPVSISRRAFSAKLTTSKHIPRLSSSTALASLTPFNATSIANTPIHPLPIFIQQRPPPLSRPLYTAPTMYQPPPSTTAEDDAYTNFLLNANRMYTQPAAETPSETVTNKSLLCPIDPSLLPSYISALHTSRFYTSDIDAPFEAVDLPLQATPHTQASIETGIYRYTVARALDIDEEVIKKLSIEQWNPRREYSDVVEAVEKWVREGNKEALEERAVGVPKEVESTKEGEVAVFAVDGEGARVEYFVLGVIRGVGGKPDRVVGMKVLAVES